MSISLNMLTFTGRVGSVFGIKKYSSSSLLEFTVAVRSNFKNKNGGYDTQWYRCKVWDKGESNFLTSLSGQLTKGCAVACTGQLEFDPATGGPRLYTGSDGVWRASFSVTVRDVVVQSPKSPGSSAVSPDSGLSEQEESTYSSMDDVPW